MNFKKTQDIAAEVKAVTVLKSTERDCPRCDAILNENEKEGCFECSNCGYIDCGGE